MNSKADMVLLANKHKKGVPPYSDLVNLKSNTMKNTLQR